MYKITDVQDQGQFAVPLNRDTEHIFYNQRLIYDAPVLTEPRTYLVSKVNRIESKGLVRVTMAQDLFDPNRDYIEKDRYGNIVGMWANWFDRDQYMVDPQEQINPATLPNYHIELSYNSPKPVIKVRGSLRKFTAKFVDKYGNEVEDVNVEEWRVEINGKDVREMEGGPFTIVTSDDDINLTTNQIRIGTTSDEMLGQIVRVTAIKDGLEVSKDLEVVGM